MARCIIALFIFQTFLCSAQKTSWNPVSCEDVNNTSASSRYRGGNGGNSIPGSVSKLPIRSLLYPGSQTRIYARFMPWFGDAHHRDVGYRSDDERQVTRQVADMSSRGIQGAIVDWYGPDGGGKNQSTILLMKEAERQSDFEFAVSEDAGSIRECAKRGCDPTGKVISDLTYAAQHFESSPAYLEFGGRPAVFFFGLEQSSIDWRRVRKALPLNPLFFFRNSGAFGLSDADGAYSWIAPETATPEDPMALRYLQRFYSKARPSDKIAMGSAYKGFNDSDASWGKGRKIDQQCGQTWLDTFAETARFYSSAHQLPALIIPTWNDYEEGTEIETGIDNCVTVSASLRNERLAWDLSGQENTIDHYEILARGDAQWAEIKQVSPGSHFVRMADLPLSPQMNSLCVEAVGKASMRNHFSEPVGISGSETHHQASAGSRPTRNP